MKIVLRIKKNTKHYLLWGYVFIRNEPNIQYSDKRLYTQIGFYPPQKRIEGTYPKFWGIFKENI